jgi:hypothetical protein
VTEWDSDTLKGGQYTFASEAHQIKKFLMQHKEHHDRDCVQLAKELEEKGSAKAVLKKSWDWFKP